VGCAESNHNPVLAEGKLAASSTNAIKSAQGRQASSRALVNNAH
jgi:hypothetical protein